MELHGCANPTLKWGTYLDPNPKEAEEDFKEGRYKEFDNVADLLRELKSEDKA